MKRLKFWIGGVVAMLAAAGIALAGQGANTATPSATFSADAKKVETRTCQGADGKYTITRGRYEGTMTSATPGLNGTARLIVRSVYNNDEASGWMTGELQVRNTTADGRTQAHLAAVNLDGNVEGLLAGKSGPPRANLIANFSATFGAGGFTNGKLGTGASGNEALLFGGSCSSDQSSDRNGHTSQPANPQSQIQTGKGGHR